VSTDLFVAVSARLGAAAGARHDDAFAVATLEQRDAGWLRTGVVLVVEEQILVEREPAQLPLARVVSTLPQKSAQGAVDFGLRGEVQQLRLVHADALLHGGGGNLERELDAASGEASRRRVTQGGSSESVRGRSGGVSGNGTTRAGHEESGGCAR